MLYSIDYTCLIDCRQYEHLDHSRVKLAQTVLQRWQLFTRDTI